MGKTLVYLGLVLLIAAACSRTEPDCAYSERECEERAEVLANSDGRNWGNPDEVSYSDSTYRFRYDTPDHESALLGPRIIVVNCRTGAAEFSMRL